MLRFSISPFSRILAVFLAFLAPSITFASDWDVASLMGMLAQNKGGLATFTETKYIAILDEPLVSTGELVYMPPNHLEKKTLTPKPESFVLDGDTVTVKRGKRKMTLPLQNFPKIAIFTESIRGTLAGDQTALEQSYHLSLAGVPQQWALTLSPTDKRVGNEIKSVLVHGAHGNVLSIEISQTDGDRSVMTIQTPTAP